MSAKLLKEIKERIKQEGAVQEIVQLNLEELRIPAISNDIKKLLEKAKNLEMLTLAANDLQNVDNLPPLDLTVLDLTANKIIDGSLKRIAEFKELGQLLLSENQIKSLEGLKPLFQLKKLIELDLSENPVSQLAGYRELLFKQIPSLQTLDHVDKNGNAVEDNEEADSDEEEQDSEQEDEDDEASSEVREVAKSKGK